MYKQIAYAVVGLVVAASCLQAQTPVGYGLSAAPRPATQTRSTRKPSMPQHSPIHVAQAKTSPAVTATPNRTPVRTAQAPAYASQPAAPTIPAPAPPPVAEGAVSSEGAGGCGCGDGNYPYGPVRRTALLRGWYVPFWHSTGDMPQHNPYFPNAHGYYYFRPYNVIHVLQQQEMVGRWGLDARNPMDNRFFERIYQEQEQMQAQDTVGGVPGPFIPR